MTFGPRQGPLTILVIHGHLAQYRQANQDIVDKPETVLHDVNDRVREDTDVDALKESAQAVDPEKHQHQEGRQGQLAHCNTEGRTVRTAPPGLSQVLCLLRAAHKTSVNRLVRPRKLKTSSSSC